MRRFPPILICTVLLLSACGGGDDLLFTTNVYKSMGSQQCSGGGKTLAALATELAAANVQIARSQCGTDGQIYPAVCGASDGRIGIFEIQASQSQVAGSAGFLPLRNLPSAATTPCP